MANNEPNRFPLWLRGLLWTMLVLGVAYFGVYGYSWMKLQSAKDALKAEGCPLTPEDIASPSLPASENAAWIVRDAHLQFVEADRVRGYSGSNLFSPSESATPPHIPFSRRPEVGILLNRLKSIEGLAYDLRSLADNGVKPVEFQGTMHQLSLILRGLSYEFEREGEVQQGWDAFRITLELSNSWREQSDIMYLDRVGTAAFPSTVARMTSVSLPEPGVEVAIYTAFQKLEQLDYLLNAYDRERVDFINIYINRDMPKDVRSLFTSGLGYWFPPVRNLDLAAYIQASLQIRSQISKWPYQVDSDVAVQDLDFPKSYILCNGAISDAGVQHWPISCREITSAKLARATLALARYRKDMGAFPADLSELEQEDLFDPYSGESLVYRRKGEGFLLYSIGPDKKDDGGAGDDIGLDTTVSHDMNDFGWE